MTQHDSKPAPLETNDGEQMDDNVDDLGNKDGDGKLDQPTTPKDKDQPRPGKSPA